MLNLQVFEPFLISLILGALLGFERAFSFRVEENEDDVLGGIRTFSLISLLGCLSGFLYTKFGTAAFALAFGAIIILTAISYYISFSKYKERGITTEISLIICFVIGAIVFQRIYALAVFLTVLVVMVLYLKRYMERLTNLFDRDDILAVLKFGIITFVVLPLLDPKFALYIKDIAGASQLFKAYPTVLAVEIINPYTVWLMVVLISGIGFTGFLAIKILGSRKGIGLTGFLGGLVSSTATTVTFAKRSIEEKGLSLPFSLAILLACSTMFPRVLVEVLIVNYNILPTLVIPIGLMAICGFSVCFFLWKKSGTEKSDEVPLKNPFNIMPAVKFGLLYAFIVFLTRIVGDMAGDSGLYIVSALSGLTDVDAITLTMSQISKADPSKTSQATIAITLAAFSNTIMKTGMAVALGSKELRKYILIGMGFVLLGGVAGLVIVAIL